MRTYKILFIDEETTSFDDFRDYVEKSPKAREVEVVTELPLNDLKTMIEKVIKISPDAIIVDFDLSEKQVDVKYNVLYNGIDLINEFSNIKSGFPCFVLTAFDDKAINVIEDVNKIYVKNILHNTKKKDVAKARVSFLERVIIQIKHYKLKIEGAENELLELLDKKRQCKTNYDDEQRIIELDTILEKSIDKDSCIPDQYKDSTHIDRLGELLNRVDNLIEKVKKKK